MMAFQHEPDHQDTPTRCDRCHEPMMIKLAKLTSESEPYCSLCGYVFGTNVAPSSWSCDCGALVIDHGGDSRPYCSVCETPMNCRRATASLVHGVGTGIKDLDTGLELLIEAQRNDELALGGEILKDMQEN